MGTVIVRRTAELTYRRRSRGLEANPATDEPARTNSNRGVAVRVERSGSAVSCYLIIPRPSVNCVCSARMSCRIFTVITAEKRKHMGRKRRTPGKLFRNTAGNTINAQNVAGAQG